MSEFVNTQEILERIRAYTHIHVSGESLSLPVIRYNGKNPDNAVPGLACFHFVKTTGGAGLMQCARPTRISLFDIADGSFMSVHDAGEVAAYQNLPEDYLISTASTQLMELSADKQPAYMRDVAKKRTSALSCLDRVRLAILSKQDFPVKDFLEYLSLSMHPYSEDFISLHTMLCRIPVKIDQLKVTCPQCSTEYTADISGYENGQSFTASCPQCGYAIQKYYEVRYRYLNVTELFGKNPGSGGEKNRPDDAEKPEKNPSRKMTEKQQEQSIPLKNTSPRQQPPKKKPVRIQEPSIWDKFLCYAEADMANKPKALGAFFETDGSSLKTLAGDADQYSVYSLESALKAADKISTHKGCHILYVADASPCPDLYRLVQNMTEKSALALVGKKATLTEFLENNPAINSRVLVRGFIPRPDGKLVSAFTDRLSGYGIHTAPDAKEVLEGYIAATHPCLEEIQSLADRTFFELFTQSTVTLNGSTLQGVLGQNTDQHKNP